MGMLIGADMFAGAWARRNNIEEETFPINYKIENGFGRNQRMLEESKPDLCIAFKGKNGTADMIRRSKKANVKVLEIINES